MFSKVYAKNYDIFNSGKPYAKEIKFVYEWAKKPRTVFDIGCGTASYWKHYPEKTILFGVEKSKAMCEQAPYRGEVICGDVRGIKIESKFDCATALFDVINYIPKHDWWNKIPVKKGGYFIFDLWDKKKVEKDGFRVTVKKSKDAIRVISPINQDSKSVELLVSVVSVSNIFQEIHRMYLYSHADIERFCGKEFKIVSIKETQTWHTWVKCRRK